MIQEPSDSSCQLNSLKLENQNLQEHVDKMKKMLEDRFEDQQKDEARKIMMANMDKLKNHKDYNKFINKVKNQLNSLLDDYVALKQLSQSKSAEIEGLQQQIGRQEEVVGVLKQNGVDDVNQLMEQHGSINKEKQQLQAQLEQQIGLIDDLNQKNTEFQEANQSLAQTLSKQEEQLQNQDKGFKEEKKKQVREMMVINGSDNQQQGLKDYLQKNAVIVQEVEQDIEEEKKQEEARLLAMKKAEEAKKKKGRYGQTNTRGTNNKYQSNSNLQKRPLSYKPNKQPGNKAVGQSKVGQANKYSASKINNNKTISSNYSQRQVNKKNGVKDLNGNKSHTQTNIFASSVNDLSNTNILNNNYMSQPVQKIEYNVQQPKLEACQIITPEQNQIVQALSCTMQQPKLETCQIIAPSTNKVENHNQDLEVVRRSVQGGGTMITKADVTEVKSLTCPNVVVKEIVKTLTYVVYGQQSDHYKVAIKLLNQKGLLQAISNYDVDRMSQKAFKEIDNMLNVSKITEEKVNQSAKACCGFYRWLKELHCFYRIKSGL